VDQISASLKASLCKKRSSTNFVDKIESESYVYEFQKIIKITKYFCEYKSIKIGVSIETTCPTKVNIKI
jgi:hypothetical protein